MALATCCDQYNTRRNRKVTTMAKARFLGLWRFNPNAPWPTDPTEAAKVNEMIFAGVDSMLQQGGMLEAGFFLDGRSGYTLGTGEAVDAFRRAVGPYPFILLEVHELIDYETGKEVVRGVLKAKAEMMKR